MLYREYPEKSFKSFSLLANALPIGIPAEGLGLGILPALALQKMQGEVQILPFNTPFFRKIALVTSSQQRLAPSTKQMIKNVREFVKEKYPSGVLTIDAARR